MSSDCGGDYVPRVQNRVLLQELLRQLVHIEAGRNTRRDFQQIRPQPAIKAEHALGGIHPPYCVERAVVAWPEGFHARDLHFAAEDVEGVGNGLGDGTCERTAAQLLPSMMFLSRRSEVPPQPLVRSKVNPLNIPVPKVKVSEPSQQVRFKGFIC